MKHIGVIGTKPVIQNSLTFKNDRISPRAFMKAY